jgi:hypothetical protein
MTATLAPRPTRRPTPTLDAEPPRRRRWGWLVFLLLAGLVIIAHGCHGEHTDDDLAPFWKTPRKSSPSESQGAQTEKSAIS